MPTTARELKQRGWDQLDILIVTGDAYVDHPAFGPVLIARWLEAQGYRVGLVAQPRWDTTGDVARMGRPRLFVGVAAGNLDSMLNKLTERLRETTERLNDSVGALLRNNLVLYVLAKGPLKWPEERPGLAAFCGVAEDDADAVVDFLAGEGLLTLFGGELAAADADALLKGLGAEAPAVACSIVNNRPEP